MSDESLRKHLLDLLDGRYAHPGFDDVVSEFPPELRGGKMPGVPNTPWRLLEHLRIVQWDILEFCRNPSHVSPDFPDGYWPEGDAPPDEAAWEKCAESFRGDLEAMKALVSDPETDLHAKIPHGDGQTYLREALLTADHNGYHLGQLRMLLRGLGSR
jgi:hypothetical protein